MSEDLKTQVKSPNKEEQRPRQDHKSRQVTSDHLRDQRKTSHSPRRPENNRRRNFQQKHQAQPPRKSFDFDSKDLRKVYQVETPEVNYDSVNPDNLTLLTVSGYRVLDCNMSALLYKKKMILIDCGSAVDLDEDLKVLTPRILSNAPRKVPNFSNIGLLLSKGYTIEALILTHCHADHSSGLLQLGDYLKSQDVDLNEIKLYTSEYHYNITKKSNPFKNLVLLERRDQKSIIEPKSFEFFYLNHSSHHSIAFHAKLGKKSVLFLPDHKEDHCFNEYAGQNNVEINKKIRQLSKDVDATVLEGTRGFLKRDQITTPEFAVDAFLTNLICSNHDLVKTIYVSTYPSNAARISAVMEAGKYTNRKVYVMGRSMQDALDAAVKSKVIKEEYTSVFKKVADCNEVNKNKKNAIVLCTGHMGEESAILNKLVSNKIPNRWSEEDLVILSSTTIPKPGPIICRSNLINSLRMRKVRVMTADEVPGLHTSGHIGGVDYVALLKRIRNSKKIVINHGDIENSLSLPMAFQKAEIPIRNLIIPTNHQIVEL